MERRLTILLLLLLAALAYAPQADAQIRRGPKTFVSSGVRQVPDTLTKSIDSLSRQLRTVNIATLTQIAEIVGVIPNDSLGRRLPQADQATLDSLRTIIPESDTIALARFDLLRRQIAADTTAIYHNTEQALQIGSTLMDSLNAQPSLLFTNDSIRHKRGGFMSDSMSLSKVCWISTVLPGYGQIYNKQYWKLPILYGLVGGGLALFIHENNQYRPLKQSYDQMLTTSASQRTAAFDQVQSRMIRSNTRRQLYLGATIASYIYFIGDAAINYSTNDVSHVKKATTLACICPGAGQIYNKSYWKLPFVIGGFSALIYCIDWNNRGFQRFKKAYSIKSAYDKDPTSFPDGSPDEFKGRYETPFLKNLKDSYRRNRDLCIIITAGLYILQIVDAHVDAHLKDYDISDDLSMNIEPLIDYTFVPSQGSHQPVFGFNISLSF